MPSISPAGTEGESHTMPRALWERGATAQHDTYTKTITLLEKETLRHTVLLKHSNVYLYGYYTTVFQKLPKSSVTKHTDLIGYRVKVGCIVNVIMIMSWSLFMKVFISITIYESVYTVCIDLCFLWMDYTFSQCCAASETLKILILIIFQLVFQ